MDLFSQPLKNRFSIHLRLSAVLICVGAAFTLHAQTTATTPEIFAKDIKLGFSRAAIVSKPAASGFAEVGDASKVPINAQAKTNGYAKFLEFKSPRAFAAGERGAWGYASGDYATGKAIGNCQRGGQSCKLYAVDDDVVWAR